MIRNKRAVFVASLGLCVCALVLTACGKKSDDARAVSQPQATAPIATSASGAEAVAPIVPSGWQTVSEYGWSFEIPQDWVEDAFMYYPEELADRLMPGVRCEIGSLVVQPDGTVEDELAYMFGPGPWTMTPVTVCGQEGHLLEATDGRKRLSLVFEFEDFEPSLSDDVVHGVQLFMCSASSSRFGQYEAIFRSILESTRCRED